MQERKDLVTMKGNPITLVGTQVEVGQQAPDFTVLTDALQPVTLKSYAGKIKIISVTPSLDTPVCDMQLRRFNDEAGKLGDDIVILNISVDLPFAIKRFCTTAGIASAIALSDHRDVSFGTAYGVLIKELRLLSRAVFIVDKNDKLIYKELLPEATGTPNFDAALAALK